MRRKRVAPRLKMQSSPTSESRLAILGPRKIDDIGSHRVGTIPVAKRQAGPRIHNGHLRKPTSFDESLVFRASFSEAAVGDSAGSWDVRVSNMFEVLSRSSGSASSAGAYVRGVGSHGVNFEHKIETRLTWVLGSAWPKRELGNL